MFGRSLRFVQAGVVYEGIRHLAFHFIGTASMRCCHRSRYVPQCVKAAIYLSLTPGNWLPELCEIIHTTGLVHPFNQSHTQLSRQEPKGLTPEKAPIDEEYHYSMEYLICSDTCTLHWARGSRLLVVTYFAPTASLPARVLFFSYIYLAWQIFVLQHPCRVVTQLLATVAAGSQKY
jgi:hypothetical protein